MLQPQARFGIEIGARTIQLVCAVRQSNGQTQWSYRSSTRRDADSPQALASDLTALLDSFARYRLRSQVALAVPASSVRRLTVKAASPGRLPQAVAAQLPSLLPYDAERAETRFVMRNTQRHSDGVEARVAVAACERAGAKQATDALWQAG
jgi:Tfp pilus assembly PilM family ATPase